MLLLCTRGVFRGHEGLRKMQEFLAEEAPGARLTYRTKLLERVVGFLEWTGGSDEAIIVDGADS